MHCIFTWYWVADFCAEQEIDFALGHASYMKSIHGEKTKSDKIDSEKIANLLRGASFWKKLGKEKRKFFWRMFPIAYTYPKAKRAVRDLLRIRLFFVRQRAELSVHLQNTASGGQVFRSWVSKCCGWCITIHSKKTFQIYKFIFSFNSVISSFKASPYLVQFICFLLDIL